MLTHSPDMRLKVSHPFQLLYGILNDPSADKYSRLNELDKFRNEGDENRFTFALRYPDHDPGRYYEWKQHVNPFGVKGKTLMSTGPEIITSHGLCETG